MLNSDVFVTEKVKYCDKIDKLFLNGLSSVFKKHRCHAGPIVLTFNLLRLSVEVSQKMAFTGPTSATSVALATT